jgi:hypothetical protein
MFCEERARLVAGFNRAEARSRASTHSRAMPLRASVPDQRQARIWFDRGVALEVVETALLLACLRRSAA